MVFIIGPFIYTLTPAICILKFISETKNQIILDFVKKNKRY